MQSLPHAGAEPHPWVGMPLRPTSQISSRAQFHAGAQHPCPVGSCLNSTCPCVSERLPARTATRPAPQRHAPATPVRYADPWTGTPGGAHSLPVQLVIIRQLLLIRLRLNVLIIVSLLLLCGVLLFVLNVWKGGRSDLEKVWVKALPVGLQRMSVPRSMRWAVRWARVLRGWRHLRDNDRTFAPGQKALQWQQQALRLRLVWEGRFLGAHLSHR